MSSKNKNNAKVSAAEEGASSFVLAPSNIRRFYHEVVAEFKKIVWPDRKVTFGLSGFVILLTVLLSIYLGAVDLILGKLVGLVLQ
ncbi:MAG: preprotein translocase subunit SecE [Candidatus Electrothrix aestuarii]|jgi:preprotein translocase subunit SecE|uniref:Protein translocase subunit SecE n=1 Tax=Candidatus Electrothrix aestuarii TaxID=3062594 RepID=A0AAU8LWB8_9BACT|nr:MAG: preprotein translocase subunit SecE [Candidatus Electrothrix sp. GW3-3]